MDEGQYVPGIVGGPAPPHIYGHDGQDRPATPREIEAFDRIQAQADRRRQETPSLTEIYGVDWIAGIKREAKTRIRTEIGLKHRLNAQREIDELTKRVMRRLDDVLVLEKLGVPRLDTLADLQEFAKLTRKELIALSGHDVSGVVEYHDEKGIDMSKRSDRTTAVMGVVATDDGRWEARIYSPTGSDTADPASRPMNQQVSGLLGDSAMDLEVVIGYLNDEIEATEAGDEVDVQVLRDSAGRIGCHVDRLEHVSRVVGED
jgi:hypothetical protein